jgi:hypothetical protein
VMVVGASPVFETKTDGQFTLSADAADGEEVLLSVTKDGFKSVQQLHPAGNEPAAIVLYPEAK